MRLDVRASLPGAQFDADVAIVGCGAAGISLCRALRGRGLTILAIDGGPDPAEASGELFDADVLGAPYPVAASRMRGFGGTTEHWTGVCRPLDADDFERREWIAGSGWPISRESLDPYYDAAHEVVDLPSADYRGAALARQGGFDPLGLGADLTEAVFRYSPPTRFAARYRHELTADPQTTVLLNAVVTGLEMDPGSSRCQGLRVRGVDGAERSVRARAYVLAAGAIETARLLLASNDVHTRGVGNAHDLVGRHFMEHPIVWQIPFICTRPASAIRSLAVTTGATGSWRSHLTISARRRVELGLCGAYAAASLPGLAGLGSTPGATPENLPDVAGVVLSANGRVDGNADADELAQHVGSLTLVLEQLPDASNRVTTVPRSVDGAGLPRVALDWRMRDRDVENLDATVREMGRAITQSGLGRLRVVPEIGDSYTEQVAIACHHLGTARMASSVGSGVVDADLRMFEASNVSLVGGAVFPTGGYANPTLTIVALALRLADRLATELG